MNSRRRRAGYWSIAAFFAAAAPPAIGAGLETVGWEWATWTGPYQIAFGIVLALLGAISAGYALGLDKLWRPARNAAAPSPGNRDGVGMTWDQVTLEAAGKWLYTNAGPDLRETIRRGVPSPFATIAEHSEALVQNVAAHGVCPLLVQWEKGLPWEQVDPAAVEFDGFEQMFGSNRPKPFGLGVSRFDLPKVLAFYDAEAPAADPKEVV